jgi:hypothetical protein
MDGAAEKWRAEISSTQVVEISGVSADMRRANELKSPWTGLFQRTLKARLDYLIHRKDAKGAKFWITVISSLRTLRLCGESGSFGNLSGYSQRKDTERSGGKSFYHCV